MRTYVSRLAVCGALASLVTGVGSGQNAGKLTFEVGSIKPSALDEGRMQQLQRSGKPVRRGRQITGARAEYIYMSLGQLITEAYQVRSPQVTGPDWLYDKRFDVVCKMPEGSKREDVPIMLQSLLEDRFKLVAHFEVTEQLVSALVVGKGGSKLKPSDDANGKLPEGQVRHGTGPGGASTASNGRMTMNLTNNGPDGMHMVGSMPMFSLAALLNDMGIGNGRPVVDMTGLTGYYQVTLNIPPGVTLGAVSVTPETGQERSLVEMASDPRGGSLQRSLQDLGLELVIRKAPIKHLIIDHVEKMPTEN